MPKTGYKSITLPDTTAQRFWAYADTYNLTLDEVALKLLRERENLRKLAKKIIKIPKTVRVYALGKKMS